MSITCLCIGDVHFKTSNKLDTDLLTEKLIEKTKELQPTFVVVLGDVTDTHEKIHVSPLERAVFLLKQLSQIAPLYVIIGNHDRPNNSNFLTTEHPFTALKYWHNTIVIDTTTDVMIQGQRFIFVPYVSPGRFHEALTYAPSIQTIEKKEFQIEYLNQKGEQIWEWDNDTIIDTLKASGPIQAIFAHQEFRGAKMGAIVSEVGDLWKLSYPFVMSGHIHEYDELQPNLIYSGTPYQTNWSENSCKTISLLSWTLEGTREHRRIELNLPKKRLVHLTVQEIFSYVLPEEHSQMKIIITGTSAEIRTAMKSNEVKKFTERGIKVVYKDVMMNGVHSIEGKKETIVSYQERLRKAVLDSKKDPLIYVYHQLFHQ